MFEYLRSKLPKRREILAHWSVRPYAHRLKHPRLWHIHRNGVSRALFIGLFCAWCPIPGTQMLLAAVWAWLARANIPVAVASTWFTNPVTYVPLLYIAFLVGDFVMVHTIPNWESSTFSLTGLWSRDSVLFPILIGSLICAFATGFVAATVSKMLWRQHIVAKLRRRAKRRLNQMPTDATSGFD